MARPSKGGAPWEARARAYDRWMAEQERLGWLARRREMREAELGDEEDWGAGSSGA